MKTRRLIYIPSQMIMNWAKSNPIDWGKYGAKVRIGDVGDVMPDNPVMFDLYDLYFETCGLFSVEKFMEYHREKYSDWWAILSGPEQEGFLSKLNRNFLPSFIDTIHAFSLIQESKYDAYAVIDFSDDVFGKVDMRIFYQGNFYSVNMFADSPYARKAKTYKEQFRGGKNMREALDLPLTLDRRKGHGNKRWYNQKDIDLLFSEIHSTVAA